MTKTRKYIIGRDEKGTGKLHECAALMAALYGNNYKKEKDPVDIVNNAPEFRNFKKLTILHCFNRERNYEARNIAPNHEAHV